jgi:hypothetical protein
VQAFAGNQPGVKFEELFWRITVMLSAGTLFEFWIWKFDEEEF